MVMITYVECDGSEHIVDVTPGESLMQGAVCNEIRGILASCGGAGGCATCQIRVEACWLTKLGEKGRAERATLRYAWKPGDDSRLACFVSVTEDLEGLRVHLPEQQF